MKKIYILTTLLLSASAIHGQDQASERRDSTETITIVSNDSLKALKKKIQEQQKTAILQAKQEKPLVQTSNTAKEKKPVNQSILSDAMITSLIQKASNDSIQPNNHSVTIIGNNIIIGNNNTIVVVDEQSKADNWIKKRDESKYTENFFEHFSIGLSASTLGAGVEIATTLSKNLKLRAGINYIDFSNNYTVAVEDDAIKSAVLGDYYPDYKFDADIKFYNGHALLDFHPMRNGIFHFTGGVYIGKNRIKANGQLVNPETGATSQLNGGFTKWPTINFADYQLQVDTQGKLDAEIKAGNWVKPYLGIGLGRSIPRNRFGILFEVGVLYQGDLSITQNGIDVTQDKTKKDSFGNADNLSKWLKWWPMINLQLVYRFK